MKAFIRIFSLGLVCVLVAACASPSPNTTAHRNPLHSRHSVGVLMDGGLFKLISPVSTMAESEIVARKASSLIALNRGREALVLIDEHLAADPEHCGLRAQRISALYMLGRNKESLVQLQTLMDDAEPHPVTGVLCEASYMMVVGSFAHIEAKRWKDAIDLLVRANPSKENEEFTAYRALLYTYIIRRARAAGNRNAWMDERVQEQLDGGKGAPAVLIRYWHGRESDPLQALAELADARLFIIDPGATKQALTGLGLFHLGAHARFEQGRRRAGSQFLRELNELAPYGVIEWTHARRTLCTRC